MDKPTELVQEGVEITCHHPEHSSSLLGIGTIYSEVIDFARHHHEYLDGSGYPDGLTGNEINDLVRIVTVADAFSALVDERASKASMSNDDAYAIMLEMRNKLDFKIVRAFEPIALGRSRSDQLNLHAA